MYRELLIPRDLNWARMRQIHLRSRRGGTGRLLRV